MIDLTDLYPTRTATLRRGHRHHAPSPTMRRATGVLVMALPTRERVRILAELERDGDHVTLRRALRTLHLPPHVRRALQAALAS